MKKKKKNFFCPIGLQKTWFFRDFPTWDQSDFYNTPRGDLDTPLYKKKKSKKNFFLLGKGGCPLKGTPPLSGVSDERSSEIF